MYEVAARGSGSLVDRLVERVTNLIDRGDLAPGARLPSIRRLAQLAAVSNFTVVEAYDRLVARGLVESRAGRGFYVARPVAVAALEAAVEVPPDPSSGAVALVREALDGGARLIPAGSGFLPEDAQLDGLAGAVVGRLSRGRRPAAWAPCPPQGLPALRGQIAGELGRLGTSAGPQHVVTTIGASQAFDLLARALFAPGDAVLVEDPGYFVLFAQLKAHHVRLVPVPRRADGPDLDALEDLARAHRPRAFFVQTLLHNPTGTSMNPAQCHRLLSLAERYGFVLVEDDVYGDLAGERAVRLAQIDGLRHVVYVGSYTKLIGPAVRVGFVVAEAALAARLAELKLLSVLSGSALLESVVLEALESGRYRRHLERLRPRVAQARRGTREALTRAGLVVDEPVGEGLFVWARLPRGVETGPLVRRAREASILLADGALFAPDGAPNGRLRFNVFHGQAPPLVDYLQRELAAAA